MHERELGSELGRFLDGFGPYDRRHTAPLFNRLPPRGASTTATLALVGGGLVAVLVVTALLVPRLTGAAHLPAPAAAPTARAAASPSPTPTPRPAALVLQVPAPGANALGLPVTSVRVDWSGHRLGTVSSPGLPLDHPSPDGSLALAVGESGGETLVDAADGHVIGTVAPGITVPIWADDSRHLCGLSSAPTGTQLVVVTVDPVRGETGRQSFPVDVAGSGPTLVVSGCSAETDRAVVTNFWSVGRTEAAGDVEVLRLSTGAVLLHRPFPAPAPFINVLVSSDGLYMAGSPLDNSLSVVVDLVSGREVAHLSGVAEAFTADDRYLAVSSFVSEQARPGGTGQLVEWRTGRTVWQDHGQLAILAVEPDTDAIAVALYGSDQEPPDHDVWLIVHPDGSAITLRRNGSGP